MGGVSMGWSVHELRPGLARAGTGEGTRIASRCFSRSLFTRKSALSRTPIFTLFVLLFPLEFFLLFLGQFWLFPVFLFCFISVAHGFLLCLKEVVRTTYGPVI